MAEDVKLNISGNMSKLKGQLSKADADIKKRTGQLNQLKAKIKQTEAKMAAIKSQMGGMAKGFGAGLGGAAIGLAMQDAFTSSGIEGSQWAGGLTAIATGAAFGGPVGAVTAALGVAISELTKRVGELAQKIAAREENQRMLLVATINLEKEVHMQRRTLAASLKKQKEIMAIEADKKLRRVGNSIARMMIARGA